ncbi:MAG: acetyl-CoA acetyltransferase [Candidatus Methanolliviera hydrocarbonicum]|uniref:Acetyl-CoA acetyltransferase n=1 Tax=Candidatus Methanolliviera hydrocarbonicum TaxID=2491085 RepID=A0A520KWA7_9EURY|nr:MAG: acetyl-CoA acetyltransferase [Candidatus Methanolliviera hydrocarbonicum]
MVEGIKDKVAIIGMGCTKFGERWEASAEDLIVEAFVECIDDAGIEKKEIDAAWFGSCFDEVDVGKSAVPLSSTLKLPFLPVTRVENFCATGTEALRGAAYAVASGASDIALALGVEKLKDTGYGGLPDFGSAMGTRNRLIFPNMTAPGGFAMMATKYFDKYGLKPDEGKRMLAHVSSKSHHNGTLNPKAHLRKEASIDKIVNAPMIAWPLGLFDCCGVSDGSAAAIVVRAEDAKNYREDPVYIKGLQIALSSGEELMYTDWDGAHVETAVHAAERVYKEAGIKDPRKEIGMMELHDCFSITETVTYEDLGISKRGHARDDIESGFFDLDGTIPAQPDGGLKCFGHPIGASGLRMAYEMYKQLQGKAGPRQIADPKLGLTHNMGGFPPYNLISISILGL